MNLLDLLFPKKCLECGRFGSYLCNECTALVLDGTFDFNNFSIFKYKGVVKKAILDIKYKFAYDIVDDLVDVSVDRLKIKEFHNVVLVPIPMHTENENFRGFNQSILIGEKLANKLNWTFLPDLLLKVKKTKHQVGLKGEDRRKNLMDSFKLNDKYLFDTKIKKRKILLFDDVYTTGTTIKVAKEVLKTNGFENIYSLTIAR